jgi:hypothetical protein
MPLQPRRAPLREVLAPQPDGGVAAPPAGPGTALRYPAAASAASSSRVMTTCSPARSRTAASACSSAGTSASSWRITKLTGWTCSNTNPPRTPLVRCARALGECGSGAEYRPPSGQAGRFPMQKDRLAEHLHPAAGRGGQLVVLERPQQRQQQRQIRRRSLGVGAQRGRCRGPHSGVDQGGDGLAVPDTRGVVEPGRRAAARVAPGSAPEPRRAARWGSRARRARSWGAIATPPCRRPGTPAPGRTGRRCPHRGRTSGRRRSRTPAVPSR